MTTRTKFHRSLGAQRWHWLRKEERKKAFVSQPTFPFGFIKTDDMSIIQPYTCLRHVMENEHTECQLTEQSSCREYILSCPNKCHGSFERTVISRKTLISIYSIGRIADFLYTFDKERKTITVKQRCHSAFLSPLCKRLINFIKLK